MPGKHSDFSGTSPAGRKYMPKKQKETRRQPRRDKQTARGKGMNFAQHAQKEVARARVDMGRKRWSGS